MDKINDSADEAESTNPVSNRLEVRSYQCQRIFTSTGGDRKNDEHGDENAHKAFAYNEAGSKQDAMMVTFINIFLFMARASYRGTCSQFLMNDISHN